jgi:hypothetical protein
MTLTMTRPGYDTFGYPAAATTGPYCGNCPRGTRHVNVQAIRDCYAIAQEQCEAHEDAYAAELAVERALEDRGYDEARAQEDYEARTGALGLVDWWHIQSPETCPCGCRDNA